jgi:hypothetical protein
LLDQKQGLKLRPACRACVEMFRNDLALVARGDAVDPGIEQVIAGM